MPKSNVNIKCKENVTKQQREAIKRLSEDRSIVINEADKGGSVVVMDSKISPEFLIDQNRFLPELSYTFSQYLITCF